MLYLNQAVARFIRPEITDSGYTHRLNPCMAMPPESLISARLHENIPRLHAVIISLTDQSAISCKPMKS